MTPKIIRGIPFEYYRQTGLYIAKPRGKHIVMHLEEQGYVCSIFHKSLEVQGRSWKAAQAVANAESALLRALQTRRETHA